MKTRYSSVLAILLFPLSMLAQSRSVSTSGTVSGTVAGVAGPETRTTFVYRGELGKWWQNSDIAKKLQLSDGQIAQLDQTFYDHKLKLIDYGADMEKQDLKLQALLDADVPNEGQVEAQVDQEKPAHPETLYLYLKRGAPSVETAEAEKPPLSGSEVVRCYVVLHDRPPGSRSKLVRAPPVDSLTPRTVRASACIQPVRRTTSGVTAMPTSRARPRSDCLMRLFFSPAGPRKGGSGAGVI